jgi:hypothetical protein
MAFMWYINIYNLFLRPKYCILYTAIKNKLKLSYIYKMSTIVSALV